MKLLFDQNISYRILKRLPASFQESRQVRLLGLENETDFKIWKYAKQNEFSIVTFDIDFYDISLVKGFPPKILWLRTGNLSTADIAEQLIRYESIILSFINNSHQNCLEIY